jgi:hypothetical protein
VRDDSHGATPLGWALYGWQYLPLGATRVNYYAIAARLVGAGAVFERESVPAETLAADTRMQAALRGVAGDVI